MPRPSIDVIVLLINELKDKVRDKSDKFVPVRSGWIAKEADLPVITVNKIGEVQTIMSISGGVRSVVAEYAIDVWSVDIGEARSMVEQVVSIIRNIEKAYRDQGIMYLHIYRTVWQTEPRTVPVMFHETIMVRAYWWE